MGFFAILIALLIEQARPLGHDNPVHAGMRGWARWVRGSLDAGAQSHGWVAWALAVLGPAVAVALVHWGVVSLLDGWAAFVWTVAVLYLCLGFRQFSHHFTDIRDALEAGDEAAARAALARWQRVDVQQLARDELLRHVIEHSVLAAHRHVFGVILFYLVFAWLGLGPAGAVIYRLAEYLSRVWRERADGTPSAALCRAAERAWLLIDHVPARVTALGFAVVGNFEDAVANWRQDAARFSQPNDGVLLAAASGAINVRLGGQPLGEVVALAGDGGTPQTDGRVPQLAHLGSVVGLIWRSVVLWMLLLALMMLAKI